MTSRVVDVSTKAFGALQSSSVAVLSADMDGAKNSLSDALLAFSEADNILDKEHQLLQSVAKFVPIVGTQVLSRQQILVAGQHLTLANTYLIKGISEDYEGEPHVSFRLSRIIDHIRAAKPQYAIALESLQKVNVRAVPTEHQKNFIDFRSLFTTFVEDLDDIVTFSETVNTIIGQEDFKRYLVVTQNPAELRATGGFWGAGAICDFQQGKFLGCEVFGGGLYDLNGQLPTYTEPPVPLQLMGERWGCQDMNWWPEFSESANKLIECYESSRGATVDGVIAINASVLERFLSIVGPIDNEEHGITLTVDDALHTLQRKVEIDFDKEQNTPKAILGDIFTQLVDKTYSASEILQILSSLHQAANEKEIQAYFTNEETQKTITEYGWAGNILQQPKDQDYLMVVNTNLQGEKSDAKITQKIEHQAVINEDGTVDVTVILHRKHHGSVGELFYGAFNTNYVRFYVPQGSQLIDGGGFYYPSDKAFFAPETWYSKDKDVSRIEKEIGIDDRTGTVISEQFGKTVFGNWMATAPGEESSIYMVYRLPFTVIKEHKVLSNNKFSNTLAKMQSHDAAKYSLYVQKQSGINGSFSTQIIYPNTWKTAWKSDEALSLANNGVTANVLLEEDIHLGIVISKEDSTK